MTTKRSTNLASLLLRPHAATTVLARVLAGLFATSLLAAGCGDDDDKVPTDNSAVIPDGYAYVKFCTQLTREKKPITLTIEFGSPTLASISTTTGFCQPPVNVTCKKVPAGVYPGRLLEGEKVLAPGTFRLVKDEEYLMFAEVSVNTGRPIVKVEGTFLPGECQRYEPLPHDGAVSDAGVSDAGVSDAGVSDAGVSDAAIDASEDDSLDATDDAAVD
jgi:hypothetical protein